MRVLCDQNVARKYVDTFREIDWIRTTTVADALSPGATDSEISEHAERHDWVVFTGDDDFIGMEFEHGVILYHQSDDPSPGAIVTALRSIAEAYLDPVEILEVVPGGWTT